MSEIRVLSDLVANQIAAGEVVERPASAVKELVENAIDAGATQISVRIEGGGLSLIEVMDNGSGIAFDEVELAFVRHATSKRGALDDLRKLAHLGFRGEALPSIAAVSQLTMRTRQIGAEGGIEVVWAGGELVSRQPVGCKPGTQVTVADLFFNTPARLKFVRSLQTESSHVVDVVAKEAAARPDIAFTVMVDGKLQWKSPGDGKLTSVFVEAFGLSATRTALPVQANHPDYALQGMLALPEHSRAQRTGMWFAVNGRAVRSLSLQTAVLEACQEAIPKGRYPLLLLSLVTDPGMVDVNVHPSKLEIRFSEERDVRELVLQVVRDAFKMGLGAAGVTRYDVLGDETIQLSDVHLHAPAASQKEVVHEAAQTLVDNYRASSSPEPYRVDYSKAGAQPASQRHDRSIDCEEIAHDVAALQLAFDIQQPVTTGGSIETTVFKAGTLRAVAQVLTMYMVAEDGESVYLIDQHAAHERVLYEQFRSEAQQHGLQALDLLVPLTLEVRPHEVSLLEGAAAHWLQLGLIVERFGEQAFVIRSVPHIWEGLDIERLARDLFADEVAERISVGSASTGMERTLRNWQERLILRACKAAVKANQRLSQLEMNALLQALEKLDNPFTCPHGRPTAIRLTRSQLEKEFRRSV